MSRDDQIIHRATSGPVEILLWREPDGGISLTIDDYWQFDSRDEHVFHEVLVEPAMITAASVARVLILGGGDGLATRNVLRYAGVERLVLVDHDPQVTTMAREIPELVTLNAGALHDPRVELVTDDARAFVADAAARERFDVVICDFPAPAHPRYADLFEAPFFARLATICAPEAAIAVQISVEPPGFWPIVDAIAARFPHVEPRLVELAEDDWASFVLASTRALQVRRPLAQGVRFLSTQDHRDLVIRGRADDHFETRAYGRVAMGATLAQPGRAIAPLGPRR